MASSCHCFLIFWSTVKSSLVNLSLITGNIGNEYGGLFPLYRGSNAQGAVDLGITTVNNSANNIYKNDTRDLSFEKLIDKE